MKGLTNESKKDDSILHQEPIIDYSKYAQPSNKLIFNGSSEKNSLQNSETKNNIILETTEEDFSMKTEDLCSSVGTIAVIENQVITVQQDLDLNDQIESMMMKQDGVWTCKACGKKSSQGKAVTRNHIESKHIDGISVPCGQCDKTFRSNNSFKMHIFKYHKH